MISISPISASYTISAKQNSLSINNISDNAEDGIEGLIWNITLIFQTIVFYPLWEKRDMETSYSLRMRFKQLLFNSKFFLLLPFTLSGGKCKIIRKSIIANKSNSLGKNNLKERINLINMTIVAASSVIILRPLWINLPAETDYSLKKRLNSLIDDTRFLLLFPFLLVAYETVL